MKCVPIYDCMIILCVEPRGQPQPSNLAFETWFLNNAELTLNRLGWPVSSRDPSVSTSPGLGLYAWLSM